jgi:hypothetical protein
MGKSSSVNRVEGNITEVKKAQIINDLQDKFCDQSFEQPGVIEREKTPTELEIISFVNQITNEVGQSYGLADFDMLPKNIHVITEDSWTDEHGDARYSNIEQGVLMEEQPYKIMFAKLLFHEMIHFKFYNAVQFIYGETPYLDDYRMGLNVSSRDGQNTYLNNISEAVIEEITKRNITKLLNNPVFADEINIIYEIELENMQAIAESGALLDDDKIFAEIVNVESIEYPLGYSQEPRVPATHFAYPEERKILNKLIDKIVQKNPEKFKSNDEAFEVFAKAAATGNILPIGRLVEKTFGHGVLRLIGGLDHNIQAQEEFVDSL